MAGEATGGLPAGELYVGACIETDCPRLARPFARFVKSNPWFAWGGTRGHTAWLECPSERPPRAHKETDVHADKEEPAGARRRARRARPVLQHAGRDESLEVVVEALHQSSFPVLELAVPAGSALTRTRSDSVYPSEACPQIRLASSVCVCVWNWLGSVPRSE